MRKFALFVLSIGLTFLTFGQIINPELSGSAGDSFSNSIYRLDWSIGECVTATHSAGDYVITQGFHQNTYVITTVEDLVTDINISVYPNPTSDFITVRIDRPASVSIELTNINGKVLFQKEIIEPEKQLDFSTYTSGIYFLTVKQANQLIKNFKIIKN